MAPETNSLPRSSARARAWVQTVVDPLLRGLAIEEECLAHGRWTWRFHLQQCELLQSCSDLVGGLYVENLEDLAGKRPDLGARLEAHDARLEELVQALGRAQHGLEDDASFVQAVEEARARHAVEHPADRPWEPFGADRLRSLAAQYALNDVTPELARAEDGAMREFWPRHHVPLRARAGSRLGVVRPLGQALLEEVRVLRQLLASFRTELCTAFDLPPVPVD